MLSPQRFGPGMFNFLSMLHMAGVTTALDMGTGIYGNPAQEIASVRAAAKEVRAWEGLLVVVCFGCLSEGRRGQPWLWRTK